MDHRQKKGNFNFLQLQHLFETMNWFSNLNISVKVVPFIYAIGEKVFFKRFYSLRGEIWGDSSFSLEKITSFSCLLRSGLNYIFHWKAHLLIFSKSEFNYFANISIS